MKLLLTFFSSLVLFFFTHQPVLGQHAITSEPDSLVLEVDETVNLDLQIQNNEGKPAENQDIRLIARSRSALSIEDHAVTANEPGEYELLALAEDADGNNLRLNIPVTVNYPAITDLNFTDRPDRIYTGTSLDLTVDITDEKNLDRNTENTDIQFSSSDSDVAEINRYGQAEFKKSGAITLSARAGNTETEWSIEVLENPVSVIELQASETEVRTGDVVTFDPLLLDDSEQEISDAPVTYTFMSKPDDQLGEGAAAQINQKGKFVASKPGLYTIMAKSGQTVAEQTIRVNKRDIQRDIEVVDHGLISDVHTSDLWIWEGVDGNDYAITGTWGGNGEAYFWDVTDPSNMAIIDTVTVDARTVNDVKISEEGDIAVITREGASNRRNGIVILDVTDPSDVSVISEYDEGLTGGVHNVFIYDDHVFAVNNGRRYDIIDISDPEKPETVSRFELDTPGHSIHDVWVEDGIAYSSNWQDGIVAVDVGSSSSTNTPEQHETGAGSFENPVELARYSYPSGWNHAAFPFKSESTGDFYVIAGDEAFPNGLGVDDEPTVPAGWIHFIKFEDGWDNPQEVARYEIPEAGTHNFWVEGDTLYIAYYNAGLRVVDISGELMGNLYDQGREIAKFVPNHHEGRVPNAPMAWGPQPYKGHIFVSDWNSGLWSLKLVESQE